ncbi:TPA: hypothetical protein ACQWM3_001504, partial [Edwardsiella piscicida]
PLAVARPPDVGVNRSHRRVLCGVQRPCRRRGSRDTGLGVRRASAQDEASLRIALSGNDIGAVHAGRSLSTDHRAMA